MTPPPTECGVVRCYIFFSAPSAGLSDLFCEVFLEHARRSFFNLWILSRSAALLRPCRPEDYSRKTKTSPGVKLLSLLLHLSESFGCSHGHFENTNPLSAYPTALTCPRSLCWCPCVFPSGVTVAGWEKWLTLLRKRGSHRVGIQ